MKKNFVRDNFNHSPSLHNLRNRKIIAVSTNSKIQPIITHSYSSSIGSTESEFKKTISSTKCSFNLSSSSSDGEKSVNKSPPKLYSIFTKDCFTLSENSSSNESDESGKVSENSKNKEESNDSETEESTHSETEEGEALAFYNEKDIAPSEQNLVVDVETDEFALDIGLTSRGCPKLCHEGHFYTIDKRNESGGCSWKCERTCTTKAGLNKCSGRCSSKFAGTNVNNFKYFGPIKIITIHNHVPVPEKTAALLALTKMLERAKITNDKSRTIIKNCQLLVTGESAPFMVRPKNIRQRIQRVRTKNVDYVMSLL